MDVIYPFSRVVAWTLALLAFGAGCAVAQGHKTRGEAIREMLRKVNVDFVIKGRVVDQDGNPLAGVTVDVRRSKETGPFAQKTYTDTKTVSGTFDFSFRESDFVGLEFRRDGYHSGRLSFVGPAPTEGVRIDGQTHTYDGVTVVLQKIGRLAFLHKYGPIVTCTADGRFRVWDISRIGTERTETKCIDLPAAPGRETPCVFVRVVPSQVPIAPTLQGGDEVTPRDAAVQLVLQDGKGGGFVRAHSKGRTTLDAVLDITTAPTDGYSPALELTPEELVGLRADRNVYFYFRLNGFSGKGRIIGLTYLPDQGVRDCVLRFYLQPDGSTNVETTSW
jgi:hypothetical protein